jgi:hypothetical protein
MYIVTGGSHEPHVFFFFFIVLYIYIVEIHWYSLFVHVTSPCIDFFPKQKYLELIAVSLYFDSISIVKICHQNNKMPIKSNSSSMCLVIERIDTTAPQLIFAIWHKFCYIIVKEIGQTPPLVRRHGMTRGNIYSFSSVGYQQRGWGKDIKENSDMKNHLWETFGKEYNQVNDSWRLWKSIGHHDLWY